MRFPHTSAAKFRNLRTAFGCRSIQFVNDLCPVSVLPRNLLALVLAGCTFEI
jgi:hypothetical protein